jgi:hypothetical protein
MNTFIKVAPRYYERLRNQIPAESPAREAIDRRRELNMPSRACCLKANIPCDEDQARIPLETASNIAPRLSATLRKP